MSLIDLLCKTARGRIVLINIYEGLVAAPAHLSGAELKSKVWGPLWAALPPGISPGRALKRTFDFLHLASSRPLRFNRRPLPPAGDDYIVYTTTRPRDVLDDRRKHVLQRVLSTETLGRRDEHEPWKPYQCEYLCRMLCDPLYLNGRYYAEANNIFWGTLDASSWSLDANHLRDMQGLVHIDSTEPVIQLKFRCTAGSGRDPVPVAYAGPSALEATDQRRFKAKSASAPPGVGTAVDLSELRRTQSLTEGIEEVVLSATPMTRLDDARFAGFTSDHADISGVELTRKSVVRNDHVFARRLEPAVGMPVVIGYLKRTLE